MRHQYRSAWKEFRREVIELDGGTCVKCHRGVLDGAVLQVHHKKYLPGKMPWEYPYELCETLCKGCHASEHGLIRPFIGWECVGSDDLSEPSGECELCGNSIRYVFLVQHEKWPSMEVGETCCDHLTETSIASDHLDGLRRFESRRLRFVKSKRWQQRNRGTSWIDQKGISILVEQIESTFRLIVDGIHGSRRFQSVTEARMFAFELLENGKLEEYLKTKAIKSPPVGR